MLANGATDRHGREDGDALPRRGRATSKLVQLLLEHHADARAADGTGATPAHAAIRAKADGARDVLACCWTGGGVLEARDNAGDVPLHMACRAGLSARRPWRRRPPASQE